MTHVRVVLVDDHRIVRQGLRSILDPDPQFEVIGEASNAEEALAVLANQRPDVVLLDIRLPDISGVELCQRIVEQWPDTAVLILTAFIDQNLVDACLRAGASGYLLKDAENLHLRESLLSVTEGNAALDPRAARVLANYVCEHAPPETALTAREMKVLNLMAHGLTNKEIGQQLHFSNNTIKDYVTEILSKLEARNRIEAVFIAKERGLL